MNDALPYRVTYAAEKSKCQKCWHSIKEGALQIAIMVQSEEDDCQNPSWYHQKCFFKTRLPLTAAAFDGFALLRYEHQVAIMKDLGIDDIDDHQNAATSKKTDVNDFMVSAGKSTRDTCIECHKRFKLNDLRIMAVASQMTSDQNQNNALKSGQANWYHVKCFAHQRSELGWLQSGELLPGFKRLSDSKKEIIRKQIPDIESAEEEVDKNADATELENQIRIQNEEYFKVYDDIAANVTPDDQIKILEANYQTVPDTFEQIRHRLADVIYFGPLSTCKKCKNADLMFNNWIYKCTHESGWTSCGNEEKEPAREIAEIPAELAAKYPSLAHHCGVRTRALHAFKFVDDDGNDLIFAPFEKPLLFNMEFVLVGSFTQSNGEMVRMIKKLGGKCGIVVHDRVTAIISTTDEVNKMGKQMLDAQKYGIQVVSEDFLAEIQKPGADPILYIISTSICDWGGDPYDRIEENDVFTRRQSTEYTQSMPQKMTLKWKHGSAVDPESKLDDSANVYSAEIDDKKVFYSVILGHVDIERNKNSYYRMQLLQLDDVNIFWLFESWGRTGTVIGKNSCELYTELDEAVARFNEIYHEKTGNTFGSGTFQKHPHKFYHLDIETCVVSQAIVDKCCATKLNAPVYDLMQMLFDTEKLKDLMCKCDLDLKQMPLGKISSDQIKMAMTTLQKISQLIQEQGSVHDLREASNKFYTLIPHALGVKRPQIIDSIATVRAKTEMLESLLNMEIIYEFLDDKNDEESHPYDICYRKLNATIEPLDQNLSEFGRLREIVRNTHGPTHRDYILDVLEIFKVVRRGESERFQQELSNHRLLWHGSRQTNFASILSNGLNISPPEVPINTLMFGRGIYFADVVSKSANYCRTDKKNDTGLMLLCEVALGNSQQMIRGFNVENIPNGVHQSVQGMGHLQPKYQYIDGVSAPFCNIHSSQSPAGLFYNEFIVYNPNQVKVKYLFKMKFHYQ